MWIDVFKTHTKLKRCGCSRSKLKCHKALLLGFSHLFLIEVFALTVFCSSDKFDSDSFHQFLFLFGVFGEGWALGTPYSIIFTYVIPTMCDNQYLVNLNEQKQVTSSPRATEFYLSMDHITQSHRIIVKIEEVSKIKSTNC